MLEYKYMENPSDREKVGRLSIDVKNVDGKG